MNVLFPYQFDPRGRTAESGDDRHIRDLLEQLLFTTPGERVNRPTFGSGLLQLVFAPNSPELAAATQLMIQGALQQWLGELIQVQALEVRSDDSKLFVTVRYIVRKTQERRRVDFSHARP
jgi:uncharacterized protein